MIHDDVCKLPLSMCGRYTLTTSHKKLLQELELDDAPELLPRFNQAPTQPAPIVTSAAPKTLTIARWGLLPDWARDVSVMSRYVNARSEKASSDATYSSLLRKNRCLVPASGFIEWSQDKVQPRPHLFTPRDNSLLVMAGIWNQWRRPDDGALIDTFTMFTTSASRDVLPLHDRMPVFLQTTAARRLWLSDTTHVDELLELLKPWVGLERRAINERVNNVRNDDAACLSAPAQLEMF